MKPALSTNLFLVRHRAGDPLRRRRGALHAALGPCSLFALLLVATSPPLLGQAAYEAAILDVSFRFQAFDAAGKPAADLLPSEVALREEGVLQRILSLTYEKAGLSVVLVADSSESMLYTMENAKKASRDFVRLLHGDERCALVEFDDQVRLRAGFASGPKEVELAIDQMEAGGGTRLFDAVLKAEQILSTSKGSRAIVLLSDGEDGTFDGGSKASLESVIEKARRLEIAVFPVGVGLAADRFALRRLAKETGGRFAFARKSGGLLAIYRNLPRMLRDGYTVTYRSSNPKADGSFRHVEIRTKRKGVTVRARPGYDAPDGQR